jgi:hypothetical protein
MKWPQHIDGYLRDAKAHFPLQADDDHPFYQVICSCGGTRFHVFKSNRPNLKVTCKKCDTEISVYDLKLYPAASPGRAEEVFVPVLHPNGEDTVQVFVMYEYGELDDDQTFDRNDISWCQVFIENEDGVPIKILDDETA